MLLRPTLRTLAILLVALQTQPCVADDTGTLPPALRDGAAAERDVRMLAESRLEALRTADAAARIEAIADVSARRRALIERHPSDIRRGSWRADEAEDALLGALPARGLDFTCLLGWPTEAERRSAAEIADGALESLEAARTSIAEALARIDAISTPDDATVTRRRRLAERELAARIPALEGIATGTLAATMAADRAARRYAQTVESLWPVLIELDGTARTVARIHLAIALAASGRGDDAKGIVRSLHADLNPSDTDRLRTALTEIEVARRVDGARTALERLDRAASATRPFRADPFVQLLIADVEARIRRELGDRDPTRVHTDLLAALPASERAAMRAAMLPRLAERFADDAGARNSALVTIAHAQRDGADPQRRAAAARSLDAMLADETLAAVERSTAAMALAELLDREGDADGAVRARLRMARLLTGEPESVDAVLRAAADSMRLWLVDRREASALLHADALQTLLGRYGGLESVERWRHEAARLAHARGDREALAATVAATPDSSPWRGETMLLVALDRRRTIVGGEADGAGDEFDEWRRLVSILDEARTLLEAAPAPERRAGADAYTVARSALAGPQVAALGAEALLALGRAEDALAEVDRLATAPTSIALAGELRRIRIAALLSLERVDDAEVEIAELVDEVPDAAAGALGTLMSTQRSRVLRLREASRDDDADRLARLTLPPIARGIERILELGIVAPAAIEPLRWAVADALLESGAADDALVRLDRLTALRPDALEYLLARGLALAKSGGGARRAEAMAPLKRVSAARAEVRDEAFWRAEIAMLEILLDVGGAGESSVAMQVRPRIAQLRLRDRTLGGDRWRRQLERIEAAAPRE